MAPRYTPAMFSRVFSILVSLTLLSPAPTVFARPSSDQRFSSATLAPASDVSDKGGARIVALAAEIRKGLESYDPDGKESFVQSLGMAMLGLGVDPKVSHNEISFDYLVDGKLVPVRIYLSDFENMVKYEKRGLYGFRKMTPLYAFFPVHVGAKTLLFAYHDKKLASDDALGWGLLKTAFNQVENVGVDNGLSLEIYVLRGNYVERPASAVAEAAKETSGSKLPLLALLPILCTGCGPAGTALSSALPAPPATAGLVSIPIADAGQNFDNGTIIGGQRVRPTIDGTVDAHRQHTISFQSLNGSPNTTPSTIAVLIPLANFTGASEINPASAKVAISTDEKIVSVLLPALSDNGSLESFSIAVFGEREGGRVIRTFHEPISYDNVAGIAITPSGSHVIVGLTSGTIKVCNVKTGKIQDIDFVGRLSDLHIQLHAIGIDLSGGRVRIDIRGFAADAPIVTGGPEFVAQADLTDFLSGFEQTPEIPLGQPKKVFDLGNGTTVKVYEIPSAPAYMHVQVLEGARVVSEADVISGAPANAQEMNVDGPRTLLTLKVMNVIHQLSLLPEIVPPSGGPTPPTTGVGPTPPATGTVTSPLPTGSIVVPGHTDRAAVIEDNVLKLLDAQTGREIARYSGGVFPGTRLELRTINNVRGVYVVYDSNPTFHIDQPIETYFPSQLGPIVLPAPITLPSGGSVIFTATTSGAVEATITNAENTPIKEHIPVPKDAKVALSDTDLGIINAEGIDLYNLTTGVKRHASFTGEMITSANRERTVKIADVDGFPAATVLLFSDANGKALGIGEIPSLLRFGGLYGGESWISADGKFYVRPYRANDGNVVLRVFNIRTGKFHKDIALGQAPSAIWGVEIDFQNKVLITGLTGRGQKFDLESGEAVAVPQDAQTVGVAYPAPNNPVRNTIVMPLPVSGRIIVIADWLGGGHVNDFTIEAFGYGPIIVRLVPGQPDQIRIIHGTESRIVDLKTHEVVQRIPIPAAVLDVPTPVGLEGTSNGIYTPDGKYFVIAAIPGPNNPTAEFRIVDGETNEVQKTTFYFDTGKVAWTYEVDGNHRVAVIGLTNSGEQFNIDTRAALTPPANIGSTSVAIGTPTPGRPIDRFVTILPRPASGRIGNKFGIFAGPSEPDSYFEIDYFGTGPFRAEPIAGQPNRFRLFSGAESRVVDIVEKKIVVEVPAPALPAGAVTTLDDRYAAVIEGDVLRLLDAQTGQEVARQAGFSGTHLEIADYARRTLSVVRSTFTDVLVRSGGGSTATERVETGRNYMPIDEIFTSFFAGDNVVAELGGNDIYLGTQVVGHNGSNAAGPIGSYRETGVYVFKHGGKTEGGRRGDFIGAALQTAKIGDMLVVLSSKEASLPAYPENRVHVFDKDGKEIQLVADQYFGVLVGDVAEFEVQGNKIVVGGRTFEISAGAVTIPPAVGKAVPAMRLRSSTEAVPQTDPRDLLPKKNRWMVETYMSNFEAGNAEEALKTGRHLSVKNDPRPDFRNHFLAMLADYNMAQRMLEKGKKPYDLADVRTFLDNGVLTVEEANRVSLMMHLRDIQLGDVAAVRAVLKGKYHPAGKPEVGHKFSRKFIVELLGGNPSLWEEDIRALEKSGDISKEEGAAIRSHPDRKPIIAWQMQIALAKARPKLAAEWERLRAAREQRNLQQILFGVQEDLKAYGLESAYEKAPAVELGEPVGKSAGPQFRSGRLSNGLLFLGGLTAAHLAAPAAIVQGYRAEAASIAKAPATELDRQKEIRKILADMSQGPETLEEKTAVDKIVEEVERDIAAQKAAIQKTHEMDRRKVPEKVLPSPVISPESVPKTGSRTELPARPGADLEGMIAVNNTPAPAAAPVLVAGPPSAAFGAMSSADQVRKAAREVMPDGVFIIGDRGWFPHDGKKSGMTATQGEGGSVDIGRRGSGWRGTVVQGPVELSDDEFVVVLFQNLEPDETGDANLELKTGTEYIRDKWIKMPKGGQFMAYQFRLKKRGELNYMAIHNTTSKLRLVDVIVTKTEFKLKHGPADEVFASAAAPMRRGALPVAPGAIGGDLKALTFVNSAL